MFRIAQSRTSEKLLLGASGAHRPKHKDPRSEGFATLLQNHLTMHKQDPRADIVHRVRLTAEFVQVGIISKFCCSPQQMPYILNSLNN